MEQQDNAKSAAGVAEFGLCGRHACRYKRDLHCLVSRGIAIAYWLVPTEPARSYFQRLIDGLARRCNAPRFEPHITVHVGANCMDAVDEVLSKAARSCERIVLQALEIGNSSEFTRTLFVRFALTGQLQQLSHSIRCAAQNSSDYELNPHLSLLYKKLWSGNRRLLMGSIEQPFRKVTFDSLKAVRCVSPTQSRADVEAWRIAAEKDLGT